MTIQSRICQHLRASGIDSKTSSRLACLTQKWVRNNGVEWTAQRWKSLGSYAHQRLINPTTPIPEGWKSRRNRSGKRILSDGSLHKYLEFGGSPSKTMLMQMQAICRIPTVILNKRPTAKALTKALTSIIEPRIEIPSIDSRSVAAFVDRIISQCDYDGLRMASSQIIPLRSTLPSNSRSPYYTKDPVTSHYVMKTGPRSDINVISVNLARIDEEFFTILDSDESYTSFVFTGREDAWSISPDYREMDYISDNHMVQPIGRASFLNKDGCAKIRIIVSPCWELQCATAPTKETLMYLLYHERCSSVHDQDEGRMIIHDWLRQGRRCYGFDQSAFTDRFPYALQRSLLHELYEADQVLSRIEIQLMDFAVKRPWVIPQMCNAQVTYAIGQGMGLNPSFPLATLTHIMVCFDLSRQLCLKTPLHRMVQIVGDDIVISNDRLAEAYKRFMVDQCGVRINLEKSMISDRFTSFCGKIISSDGIIPSTKIRPINSEASLVEKIKHYGTKAMPFFSKEIKEHGQRIGLPYPFGYGIHPDTIPYKSWLNSHDLSKASAVVINNEISDFVRSYSKLTPALLERQLDWDDHNPPRWNGLGQPSIDPSTLERTRYTRWVKPPVVQQEHRHKVDLQNRSRTPSFADRVDASTRQDLPIYQDKQVLFPDYDKYVDLYGHISHNQRKPRNLVLPKPTMVEPLSGSSVEVSNKVALETINNLKEISDGITGPYQFGNSDGTDLSQLGQSVQSAGEGRGDNSVFFLTKEEDSEASESSAARDEFKP